AGGWWAIDANTEEVIPGFLPGSGVRSLSDYIKAHPTAQLSDSPKGALRIVAGFGAGDWDNFDGNVDAVTTGVNGVSTTYDFDRTVGNACPVKSVTIRTWTAADACGNKASCSQIITVVDATPPTFTPQPFAVCGTTIQL